MKHIPLALPAAILIIGGPAQAASPCPPGFAQLQNSDACVRVSGRVRAETIARSSHGRKPDAFANQASGRVQLDVRKPTEYGPLRAVIRVDGMRR